MQLLTADWLGPGEFAWTLDSGRTLKAAVKRLALDSDLARQLGAPRHPPTHGDVYLVAQAAVVDPKTGEPVGDAGRQVARHVDATNIAAGREGWKAHWHVWTILPPPDDAEITPPETLTAGNTVTCPDGCVWHGGHGRPDNDIGKVGEWYRDLTGGQTYKKRIGVIEFFARLQVVELDTHLSAQAELEELPEAN